MKNTAEKSTRSFTSLIDQQLARWAAIATLIALAVAVYFGLRAEKTKTLELRFVAKLSLVNPDARTSAKVKVAYDGQDVRNLTKLSGVITNTGQIPISAVDFAQPVILKFSGARVLDAEITTKQPLEVEATKSFTVQQVELHLGLLNQGDSVGFEVLCDGEPDWPTPAFRIVGIPQPSVQYPATFRQAFRPAFFSLSRPLELVILVAASTLPLLLIILCIAGVVVIAQNHPRRKDRDRITARVVAATELSGVIGGAIQLMSADTRGLLLAAGIPTQPNWLENPEVLRQHIESRLPTLPNELRVLNVRKSAIDIVNQIRNSFAVAVTKQVHDALPDGQDNVARRAAHSQQFDPASNEPLTTYLVRVRQAVLTSLFPTSFGQRLKSLDKDNVYIFLVVLILAAVSTLITMGSWRALY